MRALSLLLLGLCGLAAVLFGLTRLDQKPDEPVEPDGLVLLPVTWSDLTGWHSDDPRPALEAFRRSCAKIETAPPSRPMGGGRAPDGRAVYGTVGEWQSICLEAETQDNISAAEARSLLEKLFRPYRVRVPANGRDLFTGYYEPELLGCRVPSEGCAVPLLARPDDLVMVDLGLFREDLKGRRIAGRVADGTLRPYEDRAEIEGGALGEAGQPIAFVSDPVDAFFLHIQGSGRVRLPDGSALRVGYDGQNGYPYTAIGRVLIRQGHLTRDNVSMQSIRAWLAANPEKRDDILRSNASYIFFRDLKIEDPSLGPLGAQGVPLTPLRSLAVDRRHHALGVPMWVETSLPGAGEPLNTLMIAQDTGGAIVGPVRGDVFFGFGGEAPALAGAMKQPGSLTVLLPARLAGHDVAQPGP